MTIAISAAMLVKRIVQDVQADRIQFRACAPAHDRPPQLRISTPLSSTPSLVAGIDERGRIRLLDHRRSGQGPSPRPGRAGRM